MQRICKCSKLKVLWTIYTIVCFFANTNCTDVLANHFLHYVVGLCILCPVFFLINLVEYKPFSQKQTTNSMYSKLLSIITALLDPQHGHVILTTKTAIFDLSSAPKLAAEKFLSFGLSSSLTISIQNIIFVSQHAVV